MSPALSRPILADTLKLPESVGQVVRRMPRPGKVTPYQSQRAPGLSNNYSEVLETLPAMLAIFGYKLAEIEKKHCCPISANIGQICGR